MDFFGKDNQPFGPLVSEVAPPAEYPMSRDIVRLQRHSLAACREVSGRSGGGLRFAHEWRPSHALCGPEERPWSAVHSAAYAQLSTGGKSAAAWQAGNTLYVLVVEGDAGMYSSYLDQSHGPLT